jgi:hypothetical protein
MNKPTPERDGEGQLLEDVGYVKYINALCALGS